MTWSLDSDGLLTISGSGKMANYDYSSKVPWNNYKSSITSAVIESGVTSIGKNAFYYCDLLTSVTISNSVFSIEDYAFYSCDSLTNITIPDSISSIGERAFLGCDLTNITIPDSVSSIGKNAFKGCCSLTHIYVDANNTNYKDIDGVLFNKNGSALIRYPKAKKASLYIIPDSVTCIDDYAFENCYQLTNITIPDSVSSIGECAFCDCYQLTNITIPNSVSSIGECAFKFCKSLTSVTIPNSVSSICGNTFNCCDTLTHIYVDSNNTRYKDIDGVLFSKDESVLITYPKGKKASSYIIPNSVSSIGEYAFFNCLLTSVNIPDSVSSIGEWAFTACQSLTSVNIPDSVSSIKRETFSSCNKLTSIIIPSSVSFIDYYAISFCSNLKEVTILSKTVTFGNGIFAACPNDLVIKGYSGSTAQTYAEEKNYTFIDIETGSVSTPAPKPTSTPKPNTSTPNPNASTAYTTITALPASGIITATADMTHIIGAQIISVEVPTDGEMMDFTLDPNKVLSKVLSNNEVKVDPTAMLLFNNRDTDGNIIGMSGKSDPIRFTNKGRMPVNATLEISPQSTFNETDSGLNLVEKISDFDGEKANIYLAAELPECESISIGKSGGAVINALIPDSRKNFTLERTDELEFEYIENEDSDNWNALEIYLTGDLDILYPHWNDSSIVTPSKFSNAKYTAVWTLKTIPVSADVLNTSVKSVTLPLKGAKASTKKIYVKPLDCSLSNQLSAVPEPELLDVSEVKDFLKINTDEIVLKTAFAEYCKSKWGQGSVLVYAPDSQGAIVKIV